MAGIICFQNHEFSLWNLFWLLRIKKMGVKKSYGPIAWEYPNMNRTKNTPRIILHDFPHFPYCPFFFNHSNTAFCCIKDIHNPQKCGSKKQSNSLFLSQSNKNVLSPLQTHHYRITGYIKLKKLSEVPFGPFSILNPFKYVTPLFDIWAKTHQTENSA